MGLQHQRRRQLPNEEFCLLQSAGQYLVQRLRRDVYLTELPAKQTTGNIINRVGQRAGLFGIGSGFLNERTDGFDEQVSFGLSRRIIRIFNRALI
jgi:hypothetical protein